MKTIPQKTQNLGSAYGVMYYHSDRHQARTPRPVGHRWRLIALLVVIAGLGGGLLLNHQSADKQQLAASLSRPATLLAVKPPNACAANTLPQFILVNISQQHMWACDGSSTVKSSPVTTGSTVVINGVSDATPTGTWKIYKKATNQYLTGRDANGPWDDFVHYWLPFNGPYGFHDATWQTFAFGTNQYHTNGSHGCVHLPLATAQWLYNWAQVGTTVHIES